MNILIVDDQNIVLEGLVTLLRLEIPDATISKANSGHQALIKLSQEKIDLILLDVNMPVMNGFEVAHSVAKNYPLVKIIMLTHVAGLAMVLNLAKIAHGISFKDVEADELKQIIYAVIRGEKGFCSTSKAMLLNNTNSIGELPDVRFDKYEIMLVNMMADGKTSKEIAIVLSKKEKTINRLREDLLKKTKSKNGLELVAYAFQNGLIYFSIALICLFSQ